MMESLKHHVVTLENCGPVSVFLQGDLERQRDGAVFLTVHDVGATYLSWVDWVRHPSMEEIKKRALFVHVAVPGQEPGAEDLQPDFVFPSMGELGLGLVTVLDHLRITRVVGLGDGAGANIIARFGMCHPGRVHGLVLINITTSASLGRFMDTLKEKMKSLRIGGKKVLNENNVSKFAESYRKRKDILGDLTRKLNVDILLVCGALSQYVVDTVTLHRQLAPGIASIIRLEDVAEPLQQTQGKTAEAVLLFCQGLCLLSSVQVRQASVVPDKKSVKTNMSMREYDQPNIRRLSLTPV